MLNGVNQITRLTLFVYNYYIQKLNIKQIMETNNSSTFSKKEIVVMVIIAFALLVQLPCIWSIGSVIMDIFGNHRWVQPNAIDLYVFFIVPATILFVTTKWYTKCIKAVFKFINSIL